MFFPSTYLFKHIAVSIDDIEIAFSRLSSKSASIHWRLLANSHGFYFVRFALPLLPLTRQPA